MGYTLIIAEKPNAAKKIAEALADKKPKVMTSDGVKYYEFTINGKKYVCVPAVGHLFVLDSIKEGKKGWYYPVFSYYWVPTYTRKSTAWTKKYFENIKRLAKNAKEFIDAADVDTEGEVLLYNILRFICGVENAKRMKFSTLTKEELVNAFKNLSPSIMYSMLEAGLTRHELDWLWGINATRALTLALKNYGKRVFTILSTGRVQGPTLKILLEREREIRKFVPTPYWQIELKCKVDSLELIATYEKDRIWKKKDANKIVKECKGKNGVVISIRKREYKQKPPTPFNTTDLQTEAYNQFGFSPTQTLSLAENLYQQGFISYPRSGSQKLPPTINYKKIIQSIAKIPTYSKLCQKLLKQPKLVPNEGPKTDPAHPAVYATQEIPDLKKLSPRERKIYDLIVRRTLATFAPPAKRESVKVTISIGKHKFFLTGKRTLEVGWIEFYKPYVKMEEQALPDLKKGDIVKVIKLNLLEKETQPPNRYTQGSIIKEMEKRGIGTKATRAEILRTLYERGYITGKSIKVTTLGEVVTKVLEKFCPEILSEKLTRHFEKEMEMVFKGKKKREKVIEEAKKTLLKILNEFKKNEKKIGKKLLEGLRIARREERRLGTCPKCGGELRIIRSRTSGLYFVGCSNYPKCKNAYPLPRNSKIEKTGKICEKCNTPIIRIRRKGKRPFNMCLDVNCETKKNWKKPTS